MISSFVSVLLVSLSNRPSDHAVSEVLRKLRTAGIVAILELNDRRLRARFDDDAALSARGATALQIIREWGLQHHIDVALELLTTQSRSEYERTIREPDVPELVGVSEIANMLGVTRQRASELARTERLGRPVAEVAATPLWAKPAIEALIEGTHGATKLSRKPGRPPTTNKPPKTSKTPQQKRSALADSTITDLWTDGAEYDLYEAVAG